MSVNVGTLARKLVGKRLAGDFEPDQSVLTAACMSRMTLGPVVFIGPGGQACAAVKGCAMPIRLLILALVDAIHGNRFGYLHEDRQVLDRLTGDLNRGVPSEHKGAMCGDTARQYVYKMWQRVVAEEGIEGALEVLRQIDVDYAHVVEQAAWLDSSAA